MTRMVTLCILKPALQGSVRPWVIDASPLTTTSEWDALSKGPKCIQESFLYERSLERVFLMLMQTVSM